MPEERDLRAIHSGGSAPRKPFWELGRYGKMTNAEKQDAVES